MAIPLNDLFLFVGLNAYVVALLVATEILSAKNKLSDATARKVLHILVGNVVLFLPYFENWWVVIVIPSVYVIVNYLMTPHSPIERLRLKTFEAGHSLGTVYYAISLLLLVVFLWKDPLGVIICFIPLAYGDGMAALIGSKFPLKGFQTIGGEKSVGGTLSFLVFSWIGLLFALGITLSGIPPTIIFLGVAISVLGSIIELVSPKGTDNLFIPILLGIFYWLSGIGSQIEF